MPRPLVFISHDSRDSDIANVLETELDRALLGGVYIFNMSTRGSIELGEPWRDVILEALQDAAIVLLVATNEGVAAPWVNFEGGGGWVAGARVVPCCAAGMTPIRLPRPFGDLQGIDVTTSEGVARLFAVVAAAAELRLPDEVDFASIAAQIRSHPDEQVRDFLQFLGPDAERHGVQLVYPVFEFTDEVRTLVKTAGPILLYDKPLERETGRGKDLIQPVAANDLRALSTVARLLGREKVTPIPVTDLEASNSGGVVPSISFGLTTNQFTFSYLEKFANQGRVQLFQPTNSADGNAMVHLSHGRDYGYEKDNHGLIARVTPNLNHPNRKWLFCAGLGSTGTEAAAHYLSDNWEYLRQLTDDRDFAAVLRCSSGNPTNVHLDRHDVAFDDGLSA